MKWFRHDADANRDSKLEKVLLKYGADGYALYWLCIELIVDRVDKDHMDFDLEHDAEVLGARLKVDILRVEEIMKYLIQIELFENTCGIITCLKVAHRLDNAIIKNPQLKAIQAERKIKSEIIPDIPGHSEKNPARLDYIRLDIDKNKEKSVAKAPLRFIKPTLDEVREYCQERKNLVDPIMFINFYESKGWLIGKNPMKNWKAAVHTWEGRQVKTESVNSIDEMIEHERVTRRGE